MTTKNNGMPIRNRRIRRDFMRLLALLTDATNDPDYAEIEQIAARNGLYFDDDGAIQEVAE
ncbi:hypothetical protein [Sporosarcina sp. SAFN-015]|uniref:hypothetical protein n=1 Tax=Sporosarcina sp. SAFN-015 TaxID=3387274 RepID=UPI003F7EA9D8